MTIIFTFQSKIPGPLRTIVAENLTTNQEKDGKRMLFMSKQ